jgi:hypothetical protein
VVLRVVLLVVRFVVEVWCAVEWLLVRSVGSAVLDASALLDASGVDTVVASVFTTR